MTNEPLQENLWRNQVADRVAAHRSRSSQTGSDSKQTSASDRGSRAKEISERALESLRRRVEERLAAEEAERREREDLERFFTEFDKPVPAAPVPTMSKSNLIAFPTTPAVATGAAAAAPALAPIEPDQLTIFEAEPPTSLEQQRLPDPEPEPRWMAPLRLDEHLDYDYRDEVVRPESAFDLPLKVAPFALRCWAGVLDTSLVLISTASFCGIFYFLMHDVPKQKTMLAFAAGALFLFWAIYNVLFLVYSGSTPGLKAMRLGISDYHDGVPSATRRAGRAVSLVLTSLSLGVGFAWALFDEDRLAWHDRMTKTFPRQLA